MTDAPTRAERRRTAVVRALVVLAGVALLVALFTVVFTASGALRWVAGAAATLAALATLAAAVRLFVALSLLLEPRLDPPRRSNGSRP